MGQMTYWVFTLTFILFGLSLYSPFQSFQLVMVLKYMLLLIIWGYSLINNNNNVYLIKRPY